MDNAELRDTLKQLYSGMREMLEDPRQLEYSFGLKPGEGSRIPAELSRARDQAGGGDLRARDYLLGYYGMLLSRIPGTDGLLTEPGFWKNCPWMQLELILLLGLFPRLMDQAERERSSPGPENYCELLREHETELSGLQEDTAFRRRLLARLVYAQENGQDVLEYLTGEPLDEVGVLRCDYIYVVRRGRKYRLRGISFPDAGTLQRIQKRAVREARPPFDYSNPAVSADRACGSRVTVAGYLATPTGGELYYNERLFSLREVTLEVLEEKYRTLDGRMRRLLSLNQQGRGSFLVTGSEMGVGKTTFLSALLEKVPECWGVGVLDAQNELRCASRYPDRNILTLVESPRLSLEEAFRHMLKTSRDVLCVGEITRPEEMACLVAGANRLSAGIGGTLHSSAPRTVIPNCRNLLKATGLYSDDLRAEEDLALALDLIIHLGRHPASPGRIVVEDLVQVLPGSPELPWRLKTLCRYDPDRDRWVVLGAPEGEYLQRLRRFAGPEKVGEVIKEWA